MFNDFDTPEESLDQFDRELAVVQALDCEREYLEDKLGNDGERQLKDLVATFGNEEVKSGEEIKDRIQIRKRELGLSRVSGKACLNAFHDNIFAGAGNAEIDVEILGGVDEMARNRKRQEKINEFMAK
jgi:uncharacterized protein YcaQ